MKRSKTINYGNKSSSKTPIGSDSVFAVTNNRAFDNPFPNYSYSAPSNIELHSQFEDPVVTFSENESTFRTPFPVRTPPVEDENDYPPVLIEESDEEREDVSNNPRCKCGMHSKSNIVKKEGANQGKKFYCCPKGKDKGCKFFQWDNNFDRTRTEEQKKKRKADHLEANKTDSEQMALRLISLLLEKQDKTDELLRQILKKLQ